MDGTMVDEIRLVSDSLTLCDVRCGPTEDKQTLKLDSGVYALAVESGADSVSVTICRSDANQPETGDELGELSIDGGVLGAYDPALFSDVFEANAEDFYDWGESVLDVTEGVRVFRDSIEPYEFACVPTGLDAVFLITELVQNDRRVGVRLNASFPESQAAEDDPMFQFFIVSASTDIDVWLASFYDEEDILDSIADSLDEDFERESGKAAVDTFISEIESIEFVVEIDEKRSRRQSLDLSDYPATRRSDSGYFCRYLRKVMLEGGVGAPKVS